MSPTSMLRLTTRQCIRAHAPRTLRPSLQTLRLFSRAIPAAYPRKGSEDKDSIDTEATEYSKSGTDDASARQEEAAFDPNTTNPKQEKKIAGKGQDGNPLEVSPANPEVSKPRGGQEGGAEHAEENKPSGAGSSKKAGKP